MTLADAIGSDFATLALNTDEFAQAVAYLPAAGGSKTINGVWQEDADDIGNRTGEVRDNRNRRVRVREGTLWISADATLGIAAPLDTDKVEVAGENFSVLSHRLEGGAWELRLRRPEKQEDGPAGLTGTLAGR